MITVKYSQTNTAKIIAASSFLIIGLDLVQGITTYTLMAGMTWLLGMSCLILDRSSWQKKDRVLCWAKTTGKKLYLTLFAISWTGILLIHNLADPAQAQFLNGAQAFVEKTWADDSGAADPEGLKKAIGFVFNIVRGILLLIVASQLIGIINEARKDNDEWKDMAIKLFIIVLLVIIGDFIVKFIVGDTSATPAT